MANPSLTVDVYGVHSGVGGHDDRSGLGPGALKAAGLPAWMKRQNIAVAWHDIDPASVPPGPLKTALTPVTDVCRRLCAEVQRSVVDQRLFVTLGGDHSCAIGTWSGACNGLRDKGPLGLLWIDAHMDSHVPETSPSGNLHGMPVAHLLGRGAPELVSLARPGPALRPEHICLVGTRSIEPEEPILLERLGVRVYPMEVVAARGVSGIIHEALSRITSDVAGFGISIDLDALDPSDAPGTGSPVEDGIGVADLAEALRGIRRLEPKLLGIEIAEFNPALDRNGRTIETIRVLLEAIFDNEEKT